MKLRKFIKNFYFDEEIVIVAWDPKTKEEETLYDGKVWDTPYWLIDFKLDNRECEACMLKNGKITIYVEE